MVKEFTTIRVLREQVDWLNSMKAHDRQPLYEIIDEIQCMLGIKNRKKVDETIVQGKSGSINFGEDSDYDVAEERANAVIYGGPIVDNPDGDSE